MGSIVLFKGLSQNNVITDRVEQDATLLRQRGYDVQVMDLTNAKGLTPIDDVDLFIGYQGWGSDAKLADGRSYLREANCPYIAVLGDHPLHHAARVASMPENATILVSSSNQVEFLRRRFNVRSDIRLFTSTTAEKEPGNDVERDIDVIVVGNAQSPEAFLKGQNLHPRVTAMIQDQLLRAEENPEEDPVAFYVKRRFSRMLNLLGNEQAAINVGRVVDLAVRCQYRWKYAQALRAFPVTFVGDQWVNLPRTPGDRFKAVPSVPYDQLASLYSRARIGVNLFPPYYDFHERITDMMAQGAAVATPPTAWLRELFKFDEEILPLPADADEVPAWLEAQLSDPDHLETVGRKGRKRVLESFNDETRIDLFLEVMHDNKETQAGAAKTVSSAS